MYLSAVLAVLIGGNDFRHYPIQQNKELSEMLMQHCIHFWEKVEKGIPPMLDHEHKTAIDTLKRMYPGTNGETIELPAGLEHWHKVKVEAEEKRKQYETVIEVCKAHILEAMGENACGQLSGLGYQYKRSLQKRSGFTVEPTEFMMMRGSAIKGKK